MKTVFKTGFSCLSIAYPKDIQKISKNNPPKDIQKISERDQEIQNMEFEASTKSIVNFIISRPQYGFHCEMHFFLGLLPMVYLNQILNAYI